MSALQFDIADKIDAEISGIIEQGLHDHAAQAGLDRHPLSITARGADGAVVGGLTATATNGRLYIRLLWVAPTMRGAGIGARLMQMAEEHAAARGYSHVYVDTASFQAPDFYRGLGYDELAKIDDFIGGFDRIFFVKTMS